MKVEVIYATPTEQSLIPVEATNALTAREAIQRSGLLEKYHLDIEKIQIGVFSDHIDLDYQLSDGERVEIYRLLTILPVDARRLRAEKKRKEQNLTSFGA